MINVEKETKHEYDPFADKKPDKSFIKSIHNHYMTNVAPWFKSIKIVLLIVIAIVVFDMISQIKHIAKETNNKMVQEEKLRIIASGIQLIGILLWPIIWDVIIGYHVFFENPFVIFGFIWPMVMTLIDLSVSSKPFFRQQAQGIFGFGDIKSDTLALVTIIFAIGSLLLARPNIPVRKEHINMLFYGLLISIAFIIPVPAVNKTSSAGFGIEISQRTFFNFAMGFVITSILMLLI